MAGGYSPSIRMKRKDVDDVSDEFSDFSLSSPARKIRRLDVELPPIMEEEEAEIHPPPAVVDVGEGNQERAIVVFNSVKANPLLHSPTSNFSLSVNSDLISGFKNEFLRSSCNSNIKLVEVEEEEAEAAANNQCMAVVPWVSSSILPSGQEGMEAPELMEAEQVGELKMDIEFEGNNNTTTSEINKLECDGMMMGGNQGLPQWQQQHCLMPQLPQNTSSPISWFH